MTDKNNPNKLVPSLFDTISSQSAIDLLADNGEVLLDNISESKIIDDIPILGSIVKLGRTGLAVKDLLFTKKVAHFLFQLNEKSFYEKSKLMSELISSEDYKEQVGSKLLLLIEQADDFKKPELIGQLFVSYVKSEIPYDTFSRISSSINRLSIEDIMEVVKQSSLVLPEELGSRVYLSGFAKIDVNPLFGGSDISYQLNSLGKTMLEKCFNVYL